VNGQNPIKIQGQHSVYVVLERAGTGDRSVAGHVSKDDHRRAPPWELLQPLDVVAHLPNPLSERLDRIHDCQPVAVRLTVEHRKIRQLEHVNAIVGGCDPVKPSQNGALRLLAGCVQTPMTTNGHPVQDLRAKGGLAGAGLAS
jgi:hypothetical protein